jgi:hypothetical protein
VAWYRYSSRGEVVGGVFLISCPGWKSYLVELDLTLGLTWG